MSTISKCLGNLVPTNAVRTHHLMNKTAAMSTRYSAKEIADASANGNGQTLVNASCSKVYFVAKTNAIAMIIMSALNALIFPVIGVLDFVSNVTKLDKRAFAILGTSLLDTFKSIASVIVIAVALVISFVYPRIFKNSNFKQNEIPPTELAKAEAELAVAKGAREALQITADKELARAGDLDRELKEAKEFVTSAAAAKHKAEAELAAISSELTKHKKQLEVAEAHNSEEPTRIANAVRVAIATKTAELEKAHSVALQALSDRIEKASSENATLRNAIASKELQGKEHEETVRGLNSTVKRLEGTISRQEVTINELNGRELKGKQGSLNRHFRDTMTSVFAEILSEANALKSTEEEIVKFKESLNSKAALLAKNQAEKAMTRDIDSSSAHGGISATPLSSSRRLPGAAAVPAKAARAAKVAAKADAASPATATAPAKIAAEAPATVVVSPAVSLSSTPGVVENPVVVTPAPVVASVAVIAPVAPVENAA